jgi:SPW repeat
MLKRMMFFNLILGIWLMASPFVLMLVSRRIQRVLGEDLLLGFGIATFSLCRLLSRREGQIAAFDWLITVLGLFTLINPFLYHYYNLSVAFWNNALVGAVVFLLAVYQDWKDSDQPMWHHRH